MKINKIIPALIALIISLYAIQDNNFTSYAEKISGYSQSQGNDVFVCGGYTKLYPDMYVTPPSKYKSPKNTVYLTFDDGPTALNTRCLDILKSYDIKATFFVVGSVFDNKAGRKRLKAIYDAGHTIGVHCYSHDYNKTYASTDAYLKDFYKTYKLIYNITGEMPNIFRFPGGSNTGYNSSIRKQVITEMTRRGFVYYDWNVTAADTSPRSTSSSITKRLVNNMSPRIHNIVLAHDVNLKTINALPETLRILKQKGFKFYSLSNDIKPYQFSK